MRHFVLLTVPALLLAVLPTSAQRVPGPGYDDADAMVADWYRRYVKREPDAGAPAWAAKVRAAMAAGRGPETVLAEILGSPEYYDLSGDTPQGFVRQLHVDVLGRPPTPSEMRFWVGRLYTGGRQDAAYDFLVRHSREATAAPALPPEEHAYEYRRPTRYWHHPIRHDWRRRR
jgi:hypothetical protein